MTPILLKQMVNFYPGYDTMTVTWWRHQQIKKYDRSPLEIALLNQLMCQNKRKLLYLNIYTAYQGYV